MRVREIEERAKKNKKENSTEVRERKKRNIEEKDFFKKQKLVK